MLYLLHGSDSKKARVKAHELIAVLQKKKPDATLINIDTESLQAGSLVEFVGGQGLFERKLIVFADQILKHPEFGDTWVKSTKDLALSDNVFILLEGELNQTILKKFETQADKIQVFGEKAPQKKDQFNVFALADALGSRDKGRLWVLFQEAVMNGKEMEEIHGLLFWQIKSILIALKSTSASEAGLNPFVFKKAKSFARNYTESELRSISTSLIDLYHEAHRGLVEFDLGLEKVLLKI